MVAVACIQALKSIPESLPYDHYSQRRKRQNRIWRQRGIYLLVYRVRFSPKKKGRRVPIFRSDLYSETECREMDPHLMLIDLIRSRDNHRLRPKRRRYCPTSFPTVTVTQGPHTVFFSPPRGWRHVPILPPSPFQQLGRSSGSSEACPILEWMTICSLQFFPVLILHFLFHVGTVAESQEGQSSTRWYYSLVTHRPLYY